MFRFFSSIHYCQIACVTKVALTAIEMSIYLKKWVGRITPSKYNNLHTSLHKLCCNTKLLFSAANYVFMKNKSILTSLLLLSYHKHLSHLFFSVNLTLKCFHLIMPSDPHPLCLSYFGRKLIPPTNFLHSPPPLLNVLIRRLCGGSS